MTRDTTADDRRLSRTQQAIVSLLAVVCILLAGATLVTAQQGAFSEDFEDGDADGWAGVFEVQQFSTNGEYSIYQNNSIVGSAVEDSARWQSGPVLNLSEPFNVTGTSYQSNARNHQDGIRLGLVDPETQETVAIRFAHSGDNATRLIYNHEGDESFSSEVISNVYEDEWVNFEIYSSGDGEMAAKVWPVGGDRESSTRLEIQQEGFAGEFALQVGSSNEGRELWVDDVQLQGTDVSPDSEDLRLDVPGYLQHNASSSYAVESNESGNWIDVTDQATVTPSNTDALTFYDNGTVVAGGNKSINEKVNVTATYDGLTATDYTVVATPTVDNLDLLPAWWSVNAVLSDWTMIWILLSTLLATAASRMSTTFAGIGAFVMAMIMGWIMGDVPDGIMVATIFMGLFIGLNLAANIDYSVR